MMRSNVLFSVILLYWVTLGSCWQYYTSLNDYRLTTSEHDPLRVHSEYTYGECSRKDLIFYTHVHFDGMQLLGKLIARGWLNIQRIPLCIKMIAKSHKGDLFAATSYNFQICVPRITYCHSHKRFKYFYYEWFIPYNYKGGMEWDLYFYGPQNMEW